MKQPLETSETITTETTKQVPETTEMKQPRSLVKQGVTGETANNETTVILPFKQLTETGATTNTETIILLEHDDRYLKQRCRQCYKRSQIQEDPTTPAENYRIFKNALELRGFKVVPNPTEGKPHNVDIFKPENRKS